VASLPATRLPRSVRPVYGRAQVLEAAGRRDEATATLREALDCYERKPIIPLARRTRERLAALQPAQA
jgi:hypothetical protein